MSLWNQRNVFSYTPNSIPELTFYYIPLKGSQQELYRRRYEEFGSTYNLMKHVFSQRLLLFKAEESEDAKIFAWPNNKDAQEALISNIPKGAVIEAGAAVLGWKRVPGEDAQNFVDRIMDDLHSNTRR